MELTPAYTDVIVFLSTPSAKRATEHKELSVEQAWISIHALREEGDRLRSRVFYGFCPISIHALREEGDVLPEQP